LEGFGNGSRILEHIRSVRENGNVLRKEFGIPVSDSMDAVRTHWQILKHF
jgi:hypothetical protein